MPLFRHGNELHGLLSNIKKQKEKILLNGQNNN